MLRRFLSSSSVVRGRYSQIQKAPEDPILGVTVAFQKDTDPRKINLGAGTYRCDKGKPYVLNCVREAERRLFEAKMDHEYLPILGLNSFIEAAQKLAFGADSELIRDKRIASSQSISGTGAVRIGAVFAQKHLGFKEVFIPNPTWANHIPIFQESGVKVNRYAYFNAASRGLDFAGWLRDIKAAPNNSLFLIHACAHNPTGVDPSPQQWAEIAAALKAKGHFAFIDCAYQGFASGDPNRDMVSLREFLKAGVDVALAQSFAKNFGLYGERVGLFSVITGSAQETDATNSQLRLVVRPMYSNPPLYGARIVSTVLGDAQLNKQWLGEVKGMADRIISMRTLLRKGLEKAGSTKDWAHITDQIGMFCFTGLTSAQVNELSAKHHIYLTQDGRISISGINSSNVEYLAQAIHAVTK